MSLVHKALWHIETNLSGELSLREIAAAAHTSRYHLARVFHRATGFTVMGYVRARRLGEGAKMLLEDPKASILAVALEVGYGSHEAFSRAFAELFGVYPQAYRRDPGSSTVVPTEPLTLVEGISTTPEPARFEFLGPLAITGLRERYRWDSNGGIPAQWARFVPMIRDIPQRIDESAYGVCSHFDGEGSFDYLSGVPTAAPALRSRCFSTETLPPAWYAVFLHDDHIATIRETAMAVWSLWLPDSELELAPSPDFERYPPWFDGATGLGGVELWVPIKERKERGQADE